MASFFGKLSLARLRAPKVPDGAEKADSWVLDASNLRKAGLDYLDEIFRESFKREEDNNEAIWRSLPFFAAVLGIASTFLGRAATGRPAWSGGALAITTNVLFWVSVCIFIWTLRWFWELLRPRSYRYPSESRETWEFAEQMRAFHQARGLAPKTVDDEVERELKAFMSRQFGAAASRNMLNNRAKFEARSQLLLFMLVGFVLVIAAEGTKYVHSLTILPSQEFEDVARSQSKRSASRPARPPAPERARASKASESALREGRR